MGLEAFKSLPNSSPQNSQPINHVFSWFEGHIGYNRISQWALHPFRCHWWCITYEKRADSSWASGSTSPRKKLPKEVTGWVARTRWILQKGSLICWLVFGMEHIMFLWFLNVLARQMLADTLFMSDPWIGTTGYPRALRWGRVIIHFLHLLTTCSWVALSDSSIAWRLTFVGFNSYGSLEAAWMPYNLVVPTVPDLSRFHQIEVSACSQLQFGLSFAAVKGNYIIIYIYT